MYPSCATVAANAPRTRVASMWHVSLLTVCPAAVHLPQLDATQVTTDEDLFGDRDPFPAAPRPPPPMHAQASDARRGSRAGSFGTENLPYAESASAGRGRVRRRARLASRQLLSNRSAAEADSHEARLQQSCEHGIHRSEVPQRTTAQLSAEPGIAVAGHHQNAETPDQRAAIQQNSLISSSRRSGQDSDAGSTAIGGEQRARWTESSRRGRQNIDNLSKAGRAHGGGQAAVRRRGDHGGKRQDVAPDVPGWLSAMKGGARRK